MAEEMEKPQSQSFARLLACLCLVLGSSNFISTSIMAYVPNEEGWGFYFYCTLIGSWATQILVLGMSMTLVMEPYWLRRLYALTATVFLFVSFILGCWFNLSKEFDVPWERMDNVFIDVVLLIFVASIPFRVCKVALGWRFDHLDAMSTREAMSTFSLGSLMAVVFESAIVMGLGIKIVNPSENDRFSPAFHWILILHYAVMLIAAVFVATPAVYVMLSSRLTPAKILSLIAYLLVVVGVISWIPMLILGHPLAVVVGWNTQIPLIVTLLVCLLLFREAGFRLFTSNKQRMLSQPTDALNAG